MADDYTPLYRAAGQTFGLDPDWIQAVAQVESKQNPNAVSYDAQGNPIAHGIMQVTAPNLQDANVADPTAPDQNIYAGTKVLSSAFQQAHGDPALALRIYEGGNNTANWGPKNAAYSGQVLAHYQAIKAARGPDDTDKFLSGDGGASATPNEPVPASDDTDKFLSGIIGADGKPTPQAAPPDPPTTMLQNAETGLENFGAGVVHGFEKVPQALERGAAYVDANVPALAALDRATGADPVAAVAQQSAREAGYQAFTKNSLAAPVGDFVGNVLTTAPIIGPAMGAIGAGGTALAEAAGGITTGLGRGIQAGSDLLSGSASAPGAGLVGRLAARGIGLGTSGAVAGAGNAALNGANIGQGAAVGAVLGPVAGVVGSAASKLLGIGAESGPVNLLASGKGVPAVDNALAAADAQAGVPGVLSGAKPALNAAPPETASGAPNSVGSSATTPADLQANAMTPAQAAASRLGGFQSRMQQSAAPGFDNAEYVPGSVPTRAEQLADPALAAQQRVISKGNQDFIDHDTNNNNARLDYYNEVAGNPTTTQNLIDARADQAEKDTAAAWQNKTEADPQPALDVANKILSGPNGKLAPVRQAIGDVTGAIMKADGSGPETDPEMLYGARKQINFMLSKSGQRANAAYSDATVQSSLLSVRDALDESIEKAAPGFGQYLQNYSAASREIDKQELLQSLAPMLTTQDGKMTLGGITRVMKSIGSKLNAPGVNAAKSLDDDTLDRLFNIRSDLLRENNRRLGMGIGSNTQQDISVASQIASGATHAGAHALAAASGIPGASLAVGPVLNHLSANASKKTANYLAQQLLQSHPLENPLAAGVSNPVNRLSAP